MNTPRWITHWEEICKDDSYIVCPVNAGTEGHLYLGQPIGILKGWEVVRLMERCYVALACPPPDLTKLLKGNT